MTETSQGVCADDVIITDALDRRPSRAPDHEAESQALSGLAETIAIKPGDVLQRLVEAAMTLTHSDSAGVSLLEPGGKHGAFRWVATAGAWAPYRNGAMPREMSPCGEVIARDRLLLVSEPARAWPALLQADPEIGEGLLAPFRVNGELKGTVWVIKHGANDRFEREDARLLQSLSRFAAAAHQVVAAIADHRESEERQAFLLRLSDALRRLSQASDIQMTASRLLGDQLHVSRTMYAEVVGDGETGGAVIRGQHVREGQRFPDRIPSTMFDETFVDGSMWTDDRVVMADVASDPRIREEVRRAWLADGVAAAVAVALVKDGRLVAIFGVHHARPRKWSADEVALIEEVAERTWAAAERARAEAALRESEAKYRTLFETMGQGYVLAETVRDADGQAIDMRLLQVNPAYERLMGISAEQAHGRCAYEILSGVDRWWLETCDRIARAGQPERVEQRYNKDGGWFEAWVYPRGGDRYEVLFEDITERKRAEAALRESEERFRQFANASAAGLWIRDATTLAMEYVSPALFRIYGVEPNALERDLKRWAGLIVPEDRETALAHIEQAQQGKAVAHEFRIQRPSDGAFRWIRNTDFPLHDNGQISRIGGIAEDVTEAKLAAEHSAVLLAELQHRVRNIMALLRSITNRTAERAGSVSEYRDLMMGRLLAFARVQALLTRAANVSAGIASIVRDEVGAQASHEGQYDLDGPDVALSPKAAEVLTLAIHELATNAAKYGALATPDGKVTVRWSTFERRGGPWLAFDWTEEGAPSRPQPTPDAARRRGFGSELIEGRIPYELKGRGQVTIEPGGARCHLEFPLQDGASVLETGAPQRASVFGGAIDMTGEPDLAGRRVLVVEDDYYLATDAARALRGAGAEVAGPCATEADARAELAQQRPNAAVVDVNLGFGPSFKLAEALRDQGIPFAFTTGYDAGVIPAEFEGVERLEKPLQLRQVVGAVARVTRAT